MFDLDHGFFFFFFAQRLASFFKRHYTSQNSDLSLFILDHEHNYRRAKKADIQTVKDSTYHGSDIILKRNEIPVVTRLALIDASVSVAHGRILIEDFSDFMTRWRLGFGRVTIVRYTTSASSLEGTASQVSNVLHLTLLTLQSG